MRIYRQGSLRAIDTDVGVFTAEISAADRTPFSGVQPYFTGAGSTPMVIQGHEIVPYGEQNNLPNELRQILDENHITPELLNKQAQLLWGQGPELYSISIEDGKRVKKWVTDPDIKEWLKTWDYEDYLLKSTIEFRHMNGHFTKYFLNRGSRVGQPSKIAKLEHVSSTRSRLAWPDSNNKINSIYTGDFNQPWKADLRQYPIFNHRDPFAKPVSMRYSNLYGFALENDYSRPSLFPLFNWIKLGSSLPVLLMNFNANAASVRYHIETPALYWTAKEEQLKKNCELQGIEYKDSMLEDLKDETFLVFAEGLIGIEKAGKMITSETIWDSEGSEYVGWKVTPIDQKVKNFISAQLEIAKRADFEITAGVGLHPALSNMSADGNLPSGSEQLYAFKLYLSTGVDIPESIVCKDMNYALAVNFPNTDTRIGFYHDNVMTEESTNPEDRTKNK
jgi:hypothetical protein